MGRWGGVFSAPAGKLPPVKQHEDREEALREKEK
jgi:hypothetical protein